MAYKKVNKLFCFSSARDRLIFENFATSVGIKDQSQFKIVAPDCVLVEGIPEPVLDELKINGYYPVW